LFATRGNLLQIGIGAAEPSRLRAADLEVAVQPAGCRIDLGQQRAAEAARQFRDLCPADEQFDSGMVFDCPAQNFGFGGERTLRLSFLLWEDTTHCSRTVSSFWWEPLLGTLHFQPKQAIGGTNLADSAREFN